MHSSFLTGFICSSTAFYTAISPNGPFPIQLRELIAVILHLAESGLKLSNLTLIGDSAGSNVILQLFAHILHPILSVPKLPKSLGRIHNACLVSPWLELGLPPDVKDKTFDIIAPETFQRWGVMYFFPIPAEQTKYVEPGNVPPSWFSGLSGVVDRIFISAGENECLRDGIMRFGDETLKPKHKDVTLVLQPDGVHAEPLYDYMTGIKPIPLTLHILDWIAESS